MIKRNLKGLDKLYNTVIVGGGTMGSSIALHLAQMGHQNIAVIEQDPCYRRASSLLSACGMRQQFSLKENILLSKYGADFIKNTAPLAVNGVAPDIKFLENGYLFLSNSKRGDEVLHSNNATQRACGVDGISLMEQEELKLRFPWLNCNDGRHDCTDNTNHLYGSYGVTNEGYFDPWGLLNAMKNKAMDLGVTYIHGECNGFTAGDPTYTTSTHLTSDNVTVAKEEVSVEIKSVYVQKPSEGLSASPCAITEGFQVYGDTFVNAAGPWAGTVMDSMIAAVPGKNSGGMHRLPVEPRKRYVFVVHCPGLSECDYPPPPHNTPLVVDPTGAWFRPEGQQGLFLTGLSPSDQDVAEGRDPRCHHPDELDVIDDSLFEDKIWPILYDRVPAFGELKVKASWAGFYEYNTFDQNGIIGYHPNVKNVMCCNGFSGHGIQQSPGAGRTVAELITHGDYVTDDISLLSYQRILDNKPVFEEGIV